jgi:uncharacterized protein (DUF1697 family)
MTHRIALLRGINVGKAKRIPMADLRALVEGLGFTDVRTLLNSGNVVFSGTRRSPRTIAASLAAAIRQQFGFDVPVVVITDQELRAIAADNPLSLTGRDPSRFLVAFVNDPEVLEQAAVLLESEWAPEAVAVGSKAVYLWCANGIIESKVAKAFAAATGDAATSRNWATVCKLQKAVGQDDVRG